ncbi:unnamed protein product [Medioppia subpectinata]|uniref:Uncharacterized protein n=1 Tax=Medioppia subpectinata TaxID=1979941 RepID=A0A7R9L8X6_9ACAR|nr:unnamed protein product [Medioppia subpectinata]CAG2116398.1 unnamed protein product [Medioppia subpectinata]
MTIKGTESNVYRGLRWGLIVLSVIVLVSVIIVLAVDLVSINRTNPMDTRSLRDKYTAKAIIITIGVLAILLQIAGVVGAATENICLCSTYGIMSIVLASFSLIYAIMTKYVAGYYLFVIFLISGLDAVYIAKYDT